MIKCDKAQTDNNSFSFSGNNSGDSIKRCCCKGKPLAFLLNSN